MHIILAILFRLEKNYPRCDKSFKTSVARKYHFNTHGNPNGRKRGLNADVDPMKAAAKRRHCPAGNNYRAAIRANS